MAYKKKTDAIRYNNEFIKQAYDRVNLTLPKGRKDTLQALAQTQGESLNSFITTAIDERIERLQGTQSNADVSEVEPALLGLSNLLIFKKANDDDLSAVYIERKTGVKYKIYQDDSKLWDEPKKNELLLSNLYTEYRTGIKYQVHPYVEEEYIPDEDKEAKTQ